MYTLHVMDKCFYHLIFFPFYVLNFNVILSDEWQQLGLSSIQTWLIKKILQSTMVSHQRKFASKKVIYPHLKGVNDSCELQFMCEIMILMVVEILEFVVDYIPILIEKSTETLFVYINVLQKIFIQICNLQYMCINKEIL